MSGRPTGVAREPVRLVLWPHRALGTRGAARLMTAVGIVMLVPATTALALGVWPLAVTLGLAYVGFALALRTSNRQASDRQVIEISAGRLHVTETTGRRERHASFDPYWARVELAPDPYRENRVLLSQSGRTIEIGRFLTPPEREQVARQLRAALLGLRSVR